MIEQKPSLLLEGPFCGVAPTADYWKAVRAAKKLIGSVLKDQKLPSNAGKKAGRKFSTYNDWIDQCEPHLDACGLIFQQSSPIEQFPSFPGGPPARCVAVVKFILIHVESGTGMIYRMDWPLWGFQGPAPDDRGAALGYAIKYGLRGIFNISQTDEKNEVAKQMQPRFVPQQQQQAPARTQQMYQQGNNQPVQGGYGQNRYGGQQQQQQQQQMQAPRPNQSMNPPVQQQQQQQQQQQNYSPGSPPFSPDPRPQQPVHNEPIVNQAHAQLGPNSPAVQQAPVQGATREPGFEELMAVGWNEDLARNIAAIPADEKAPEEVMTLWLDAVVNGYFQGDHGRANALWLKDENGPSTGFVPNPGSGVFPTGEQLRRYCVKINWNNRAPARTGA